MELPSVARDKAWLLVDEFNIQRDMTSHRHKDDAPHRASSAAKPSWKRRLFFLALPYIAVLGLFWIVNPALPYIDPSLDIPFTLNIQLDGITYREINRSYLEPFFPAGSPMIPELKNTLLRPAKTPNSLRVLCLGESSMFGVPFSFAATIPALVRKQLRHLYPDLDIEVVNLGASAINTNAIREMVPQFLSLEPDLVLVYTGHNEFYGPDGIGIPWIERQIPGLTPWKYRLRRLPMMVALQRWIRSLSNQTDGERNLMRQVSGGAEVPLDSPETRRIFGQFQENLHDIVHSFRQRNIPIILGEISSNLMFPPFAPRPTLSPDPLAAAVTSGRYAAAESLLAKGHANDSANAYYLYWRGRLSLAEGDSRNAVRFLGSARDNDLLKFRAPGQINDIIHQIGREESVPVLPIDSLLRAWSPNGVTDSTFFCEHLHPAFRGYDQIARMYVKGIVDLHVVHSPRPPAASLLPFDPDSLSVPWLDLEFGAFSLRALTTRWPFTNMPPRRDILDTCPEWELKIVKDLYIGTVGWTDALLQYAQKAKELQMHSAVVTAMSALVEEYPDRYFLRYGLAAALENAGRRSEAIQQYRRLVELSPGLPQPTIDFAFLLIDEGQYDEAQRQLQTLVAGPTTEGSSAEFHAMALCGLAIIAANRDSISTALGFVEESLRLVPGYQAALSLKSQIQSNIRK
jgi:tetratricopeptide (TPR) repeat protein/lysophospholipase L1-like esterase